MKGDGRVFRRGQIWWVEYAGPIPGRASIRESSRSSKRRIAEALLKERRTSVENQRSGVSVFVTPKDRRVTFDELADSLISFMRLHEQKSLRTAEAQLRNPRRHFGTAPATQVTGPRLRKYQEARRKEGAAKATVDREVGLVVRAFHLAQEDGRVVVVPRVGRLLKKDENARRGFLSPAAFNAVAREITDSDFRDWLEFFWITGMRNSEIGSLTWSGYEGGQPPVITLFSENAKTGEARQLPVVGPLVPILQRRTAARRLGCPYIFHWGGKPFRTTNGGLPNGFYSLWSAACERARVSNLRIYDLRRSAIRNLTHAGVPEKYSMGISGHKTRASFRRYLIQDLADSARALGSLGDYLDQEAKARTGNFDPGQIPDNGSGKGRKP